MRNTKPAKRERRRTWLGVIGALVFVGLILLGSDIATWS